MKSCNHQLIINPDDFGYTNRDEESLTSEEESDEAAIDQEHAVDAEPGVESTEEAEDEDLELETEEESEDHESEEIEEREEQRQS